MEETYYHFFCVRNQIDSIDAVMDSLENQTILPQKIIVVDDGSTDGTTEILKKHQEKYPHLIEIIRVNSTTTDFSRIPLLWNMCLDKQFTYHWIGAGDNVVAKDYAEILLKELKDNPKLAICSGDGEHKHTQAPLGGGRFVRQSFFFDAYRKYESIMGYESEILYRADTNGFNCKTFSKAVLFHAQELGTKHNFHEFGYGMRTLGYYPLYAVFRCLLSFIRRDSIPRIGTIKMLYYYLSFKPKKSGYYRLWSKDVRSKIRLEQKIMMVRLIKKAIKNPMSIKKVWVLDS